MVPLLAATDQLKSREQLAAELLALRLRVAELEELANQENGFISIFGNQEDRLRDMSHGVVNTIGLIQNVRDPYTSNHQLRVAPFAARLASELGLGADRVEGIRTAAIIHDIGKISVPSEILNKPGKLSPAEYRMVQTHPRVGFDILKAIEFPWPVSLIIMQHHERINGSGYPLGLAGGNISLDARILAVADVVEAMTSHRPYRPALEMAVAKYEIVSQRGLLYDPAVVDACLNVLENYELDAADNGAPALLKNL